MKTRLVDIEAARDRAAAFAHARIDDDLESGSAPVRRALAYLRAHLFDPELSVKRLQRKTGNEESTFFHAFRDALGVRPKAYIESLRLETAGRMLRENDIAVQAVATTTGFGSLRTFRSRFRKRFGTTPVAYARAARAGGAPPTDSPSKPTPLVEATDWHGVLAAWSEAERRDRVSRRIELAVLDESAERRAEQAWSIARDLSPDGRDDLVRHVARTTPALVELLFARSRVEGRGDRAHGVTLAELALRAIPEHTNFAWTGAKLAELRIRAHAWLGNAHRLCLDFTPATQAFADARSLLESTPEPISDFARCELARLEAGLYWVRTDYEKASKLADEAVALAEDETSDAHPLLVSALRRRASIAADDGKPIESITDLERALDVMGTSAIDSDRLPIHLALAQRFVDLQNAEAAASHLAITESLLEHAKDSRGSALVDLARGRIEWLRGRRGNAVEALQSALHGFEAHDSRFDIIVVLTDLAIVNLEADHFEAAVPIVNQLLPALRLLDADRQWRQLVVKLSASLARRTVTLEILRRVKETLPRIAARGASAQINSEA